MRARRFAGASVALGLASCALGQQTFYRVYGYEQPLAGWLELNAWGTSIASSALKGEDFGKEGRGGLFANTYEFEYGLTEHFSFGGYADFDASSDGPYSLVRERAQARYRFGNRYDKTLNLGLYAEYYFPKASFSDSQELETRIIVGHDFNDLRLKVNPIFGFYTTGSERGQVSLSFASGLYYRRRLAFQPGLELYDDFGNFGRMPALRNQKHVLFVTGDFHWKPYSWINVGVGAGLTPGSDGLTLKAIYTYEFPLFRPKQLFKGTPKGLDRPKPM